MRNLGKIKILHPQKHPISYGYGVCVNRLWFSTLPSPWLLCLINLCTCTSCKLFNDNFEKLSVAINTRNAPTLPVDWALMGCFCKVVWCFSLALFYTTFIWCFYFHIITSIFGLVAMLFLHCLVVTLNILNRT